MAKKVGRVYVSAVRYMIMSLVGSGLFLIGLSLLYSITGHLLMSPAKEALESILPQSRYTVPLTVILLLLTIGLGIKSGLYPFHTWIPDAYGYTTPAASAGAVVPGVQGLYLSAYKADGPGCCPMALWRDST